VGLIFGGGVWTNPPGFDEPPQAAKNAQQAARASGPLEG